MASEDYSVKTKVTADVSNFEKGMNKVEKSLKGFSNKLADSINRLGKKGLIGSIANVTLAMQGLTGSLSTVIKFAQQMGKAINECTEAYKGQVIAERALDTAIQNNPFITGSSSKALKEFASEMQKVSNYGDEQLIPMMTNLVSLGRTESETMQIMAVAMDMSAGMGISLETAITQLNATLNGSIGRLGQQNAELKGLTEEELRQGKAIEILGEKFKGLSSATADTSKQLKNIRGDFKEAIGEFSLPSSEMWNKFWAGFYERGIEILKQFDAYLDSQTFGKNLAKDIEKNYKTLAGTSGGVRYLRDAFNVVTDAELSAMEQYLSGLRKLNANQQQMLTAIRNEKEARKFVAEEQDRFAKKKAEQAKAEADALAEAERKAKELAELQKKQAEERAKQLKIENQWQDKILEQQISMLEAEKNSAVEGAEERGEATYEVERYYNEKILALKLQQIEREREEALKGENVTADAKIAINQYYDNEVKKIYNDLGNYKKKKNDKEKKDTKKTLSEIVSYVKQYAEKIKQVFSKVVSTIKNAFSSGFDLIKKLVSINVSDMLDNILEFEDAVLTFFVETLPQLPAFVNSVVQSIKTLLKTPKASIKRENIAEAVFQMIKSIGDNLPEMVDNLLYILESVVGGALDGLLKWLDEEDGFNTIFNIVLSVQKSVEKFVTEGLDNIATVIENHIDDFANFLAESMASANRTLPSLIRSVLRLINALIQAIAKAFENEDFQNSIVESIEGVVSAIVEIAPKLVTSIVELIFALINAIVPRLPEIIMALVNGLADAIPKCIGQIVSGLAKGIGQIFKGLFERIFTWDFWKDALQTLGQVLTQIVADVFSGGLASLSGGAGNVTGNVAGDIGLGLATGGVSYLGHLFGWWAKGTNNAPAGLSIVGEAGPELVRFRGGEQVINNRNTQKLLSDAGGKTINQSITFNNIKDTSAYAMMNQLKQYNRQMAINGVI